MPSLYTQIDINAPKSAVWQALIRKERWIKWNTFLYDRDPKRPFRAGSTVSLSLRRLREESETEFQPQILALQPESCLRWAYKVPGYQSVHIFELQEIGRHQTQYIHQEIFSGVLSQVVLQFLRRDEHQGMKRMAWELKRYVEGY
jgi:hypothetical protein